MATSLAAGLWVARSPAASAGIIIELPLIVGLAYWYSGRHQEEATDSKRARQLFLLALIVRLLVLSVTHALLPPNLVAPDQVMYDKYARYLSLAWSGESVPAKVGERVWPFYYQLCAFLYYLFGHSQLLPKFLNAVAGALSVAILYRLARRWAGARAAWWAGVLVAFLPSLVLWSVLVIRDPLVVFALAVGFDALDRFRQQRTPGALVGVAGALALVVLLRDYMAAMAVTSVGVALLVGGGESVSGRRLVASVAGVVLGVMVLHELGYTDQFVEAASLTKLQDYREGMAVGRAAYGEDVDISTPGRALSFLPVGVAYFLLSPFPWAVGSTRQLLAIPESYLWWSLIPFTIIGIRELWRAQLPRIAPVLVFLASVTGTYSLVEGNMGTAYRHRSQVMIFFLLFTGVGIAHLIERRSAQLTGKPLEAPPEVPSGGKPTPA